MNMLIAIALTFVAVIGSSSLHYEAIQRLDRLARRSTGAYPALLFVICGLVGLHLLEIGIYAAIFHLADQTLSLGDFNGKTFPSSMDYFYYAAEAYASLGYNNVIPAGEMRLVTSIAPLNGLLLLTWSGSFLFSLVEDWRGKGK